MLGREPTAIPFSAEAVRASLLRLQSEWETYQTTRDRDGVYGYLSAVFETVMAWTLEGRAVNRALGRCTCKGIHRSGKPNHSRP